MTGRPESPWWEFDPGEKPVPLDPDPRWQVDDDAALIVATAREDIAREDTEPTLQTLMAREQAGGAMSSGDPSPGAWAGDIRRRALVLLAAGCVGMFALGWRQGASAGTPTTRTNPGMPMIHEVNQVTYRHHPLRFPERLVVNEVGPVTTKEVGRR